MITSTSEKKAFLLSIGTINIQKKIDDIPSTSGPSTGEGKSLFISFDDTMVRLLIDPMSPIKGKITNNNKIKLYYDNYFLLEGFIKKIILHCPNQAYLTISEKCIYDCKFCSVPKIGNKIKTKDEILKLLENSVDTFHAISLTSGVFQDPKKDIDYIIDIITSIINKYNVPIGVSIVPFDGCSSLLKKIGVLEVKYNIETFNFKMFKSICPNLNYKIIIKELIKAVSLFGKGHVFTNLIIGLGENDNTIIKCIEYFSKHGVITNLRPISYSKYRNSEFMKKPSKDRLIKLFKIHKNILNKYNLLNIKPLSMCSICGGCDLNPQIDEYNKNN